MLSIPLPVEQRGIYEPLQGAQSAHLPSPLKDERSPFSSASVMPEREGRVCPNGRPTSLAAKVAMQGYTSIPTTSPEIGGIGLRCDLLPHSPG